MEGGQGVALDIDGAGFAHGASLADDERVHAHERPAGGAWTTQTLDATGGEPSLDASESRVAAAAWTDAAGDLRASARKDGPWSTPETIAAADPRPVALAGATFALVVWSDRGRLRASTADFGVTARPVCERDKDNPLTVHCDGSASTPPGRIARFEWDFDGDGTADSTAELAEFTYADTGPHAPKLTVTDEATPGRTDSATVALPGCERSKAVGPVSIAGCLFGFDDRWVAIGPLNLNGLDVRPSEPARIVLMLSPLKLTATGPMILESAATGCSPGPRIGSIGSSRWSTRSSSSEAPSSSAACRSPAR